MRALRLLLVCCLTLVLPTASVFAGGQGDRGDHQGRPGGPPPGADGRGMGPAPPGVDPKMGKLTLEVMALRQIHAAGFTRKDLQATASVLREIIASERELQKQAETALAAERQALLKASSEDPLPKSAASALAEAAQAHGQRMGRLLERLSSAIGDAKAMTIRQVLGMMPMSMGMGMPPWPKGSDGQPGARGQKGPGGTAPEDAGAKPAQPAGMGGGPPRSGSLQGPFGRPGQGAGMPQMPGMGGGPWGQPGMMPFMGPHLTTSELLDLIQEKLAAMRQ